MNLVDEEDDAAFRLGHLVDDALQTFLELTLVLGTSHQCTHVERIELLVLQVLGHIATNDTTCKPFDDGGLTRTGFANQNRIVLGTTTQDLEQTTNLVITANDGVELTLAGKVDEVLGILLQRLVVLVGTLRLHLLTLAQFLNGCTQFFLGNTRILEDTACGGSIG